MSLKRYTTQELQSLLSKIFYDYMVEQGVNELHKKYDEKIKEYISTIDIYHKGLQEGNLEANAAISIKEQLDYLYPALRHLQFSNMEYQKDLYARTQSTDFCRSTVQIPLNKRINSFYDDLILEVLFYDDVCTPMGKFNKYNSIESEEEQLEFLIRNTEITNIGLVFSPNGSRRLTINVFGKMNYNSERAEKAGIKLLPSRFSDFENLRLKDIQEINNNDLEQWIQSKIDLDKENMEELSRVFIRGDYYSIHRSDNNDLYIRYICRSTGRVYYNELNLENLKLSDYFKEKDYESYAKAWWNLTHLGSKCEGKPVIAC